MRPRRLVLIALVALSLGACRGPRDTGHPAPASSPAPRPNELRAPAQKPPPPAASNVELPAGAPAASTISEPPRAAFEAGATATVRVPGDKDVLVVHGAPGDTRALVYLHGRCGDVTAFRSWAAAASKLGTLAALLGDERCEGSSRTRWGRDLGLLDRRITSALAAVSEARGEALDDRAVTLLGYSAGASRAAMLASRYPDRYPRLILIAAPLAPPAGSLKRARAVVFVAGARDRREHLREAAEAMIRAGSPATFMLLPGAAHGEYGPDASRVMGEALAWAFTKAP